MLHSAGSVVAAALAFTVPTTSFFDIVFLVVVEIFSFKVAAILFA
jgi:hypothetical protein